jgi:hypothetical protein
VRLLHAADFTARQRSTVAASTAALASMVVDAGKIKLFHTGWQLSSCQPFFLA